MSEPEQVFSADTWRREAEAVIDDIRRHVREACVAALPCSDSAIYLNIETLESRRVTVLLTAAGFRVCGDGYNNRGTEASNQHVFETPYSLLQSISPGYVKSFGTALSQKLETLQDSSDNSQ